MGRKYGQTALKLFLTGMAILLLGGLAVLAAIMWHGYKTPYIAQVYQIEKVDLTGVSIKSVYLPGQKNPHSGHQTSLTWKNDAETLDPHQAKIQTGAFCYFWEDGSDGQISMAVTKNKDVAEAWAKGGPDPFSGPGRPEFYKWVDDPLAYNQLHYNESN